MTKPVTLSSIDWAQAAGRMRVRDLFAFVAMVKLRAYSRHGFMLGPDDYLFRGKVGGALYVFPLKSITEREDANAITVTVGPRR